MIGVISQALTYVVPFLLVLTLVVTVHELGHFLTARAFGVQVHTEAGPGPNESPQ